MTKHLHLYIKLHLIHLFKSNLILSLGGNIGKEDSKTGHEENVICPIIESEHCVEIPARLRGNTQSPLPSQAEYRVPGLDRTYLSHLCHCPIVGWTLSLHSVVADDYFILLKQGGWIIIFHLIIRF